MRSVRRIVCVSAIFMVLCGLTGCEKMENGPAANLPDEATEVWIKEVQAQVDNARTEVENVVLEAERLMEEAEAVMADTDRIVAELEEAGKLQKLPEETPQPVVQPRVYEFTHSDKEYFSDALFIGDSRTMGLKLYGSFDNADYFAEPGLSLYSLPRTRLAVGEHEKIGLTELLEKEAYGKIYLMLGINELGYNFDTTLEKYHALVEELRTKQPEAILYVCANLHVTSVRNEHDEIHNNANIDKINAEIEALADEQDIFYLDVNVLFDDEEGNLDKEIASDDSHILGEYYEDWCSWLGENTIVK